MTGRTIAVLKLGGELVETPDRLRRIARAIARMAGEGPLVVVHGGGRDIDADLAKLGIGKRAVDGLRVTDEATLAVVVGILAGRVNTRLVAAIVAAGGRAVGLTGADAGLGLVEKAAPHRGSDGTTVDLGLVGRPIGEGPIPLLEELARAGYVPVLASIGVDRAGALYNVNADTFAAHLAVRLQASRLVVAGGTAGVLAPDGATIGRLSPAGIAALVGGGGASAGMVAKLAACEAALAGGVGTVSIVDGRDPERLEGAAATAIVHE